LNLLLAFTISLRSSNKNITNQINAKHINIYETPNQTESPIFV